MLSIKEYAKSKGVTVQAVYKQMRTHSEALENHIQTVKGIKYLDEFAVEYLNAQSESSPAVVVTENKDLIIEELKKNIEMLLTENNQLERKLREVSEWKADQAKALAQAEYHQLMLEDKSQQLEEKKQQLKEKDELYQEAKKEADTLHLENSKLQEALNQQKVEANQQIEAEKTRKLKLLEALKRVF